MIREVTMYQACCDRCGVNDEQSEYVAWIEPEQALIMADESGFLDEVGDRLLCIDCWEWSEDESEKVEKPSPVAATCLDCEPPMPMPFTTWQDRDAWAAEHVSATNHDVRYSEQPRSVVAQ